MLTPPFKATRRGTGLRLPTPGLPFNVAGRRTDLRLSTPGPPFAVTERETDARPETPGLPFAVAGWRTGRRLPMPGPVPFKVAGRRANVPGAGAGASESIRASMRSVLSASRRVPVLMRTWPAKGRPRCLPGTGGTMTRLGRSIVWFRASRLSAPGHSSSGDGRRPETSKVVGCRALTGCRPRVMGSPRRTSPGCSAQVRERDRVLLTRRPWDRLPGILGRR